MTEEPAPKRQKHSRGGYICEFVVESNEIEGEEWRRVPDSIAPGNSTLVSNKGRMKSCYGVITTPAPGKNGYVRAGVRGKTLSMHRVVLAAFDVEAPSPAHQFCNHKDMDRSNNCLENLEWCTNQENIQHSYDNNTQRKSSAHKRSKPVRGKRVGAEEWVSYESIHHAARELGLNPGSVSQSVTKCVKAGEYIFQFDEPNEPPLLEGEEWKKWGSGQISNMARYKDCFGVVKTPSPEANGYASVQTDRERVYIHVLVAKLFLPPPETGQTQVDHINGKGNQWWNLRWVTPFENMQHSQADPNRKSGGPKRSKKVRVQKIGSSQWRVFDSGADAARILGLNMGSFSTCCRSNLKGS